MSESNPTNVRGIKVNIIKTLENFCLKWHCVKSIVLELLSQFQRGDMRLIANKFEDRRVGNCLSF